MLAAASHQSCAEHRCGSCTGRGTSGRESCTAEAARVVSTPKASIAAAPELGRSWLVEWRFRVRAVVAGRPAGGRSVLLNNSVRALGWAGVRQPGRRGAGPRLPARRPAAGAPLPLSRGRAARLPGWQPSARSPEPRCPAPGSQAARPPAAGLPSRQPGCPACRYETHVRHGETGQNQVSTRAPGVVALLNCGISHCAASLRDYGELTWRYAADARVNLLQGDEGRIRSSAGGRAARGHTVLGGIPSGPDSGCLVLRLRCSVALPALEPRVFVSFSQSLFTTEHTKNRKWVLCSVLPYFPS